MKMGVPLAIEESFSDEISPLREVQRRLITFETLSLPLRILTVITLGEVVLSGILLATTRCLSLQIVTNVTVDGRLIQVPLAVYLTSALAMLLGWWCIIMASLRIKVVPRLALCALAAGILGTAPFLHLYTIAMHSVPRDLPFAVVVLPAAQVMALVTLLAWVVTFSVIDARHQSRALRSHTSLAWVGSLIGIYFIVDIFSVIAYDPTAAPRAFIPSSLAAQSTLLPSLLAVVIYWGSTDFIEWGETLAANVAVVVNRRLPLWAFFALVTVCAGAFVLDTLRRLSLLALLPSLVTASVVVLVILGLMRLARMSAAWPADAPIGALIAGAIFLFLFAQISLDAVSWFSVTLRMPSSTINPFYTILSVGLAVTFLSLGLRLIIRSRHDPERVNMAASGLFMGMIAVLVIALSAPQLANVLGLPVVREIQPNIADFKLMTGVTIISTGLWLALRKRLTTRVVEPFTRAFILLVGLQVIGWYFQLFLPGLYALSSRSAIIAALVFVAAILWDVITSGAQVTNQGSPAVPRSARLLLYLGYALFACTTFLYASSQHFVTTGQVVPLPSQGAALEVVGAEGLGLPLLAYTFAQRLWQWHEHSEPKGRDNA